MKCFHFQNVDLPTLARALRHHQFEPEFIRHPFGLKSSEIICMARFEPGVRATPIPPSQLAERVAMYDTWRTLSVLASPDSVSALYEPALRHMTARAAAAGHLRADKSGRLVPQIKLKTMHAGGYEALNEAAAL
jgi:hypothetical protein